MKTLYRVYINRYSWWFEIIYSKINWLRLNAEYIPRLHDPGKGFLPECNFDLVELLELRWSSG